MDHYGYDSIYRYKSKNYFGTLLRFFDSDQAENLVIFLKHVYFWVPVQCLGMEEVLSIFALENSITF